MIYTAWVITGWKIKGIMDEVRNFVSISGSTLHACSCTHWHNVYVLLRHNKLLFPITLIGTMAQRYHPRACATLLTYT